MLTDEKSLKPTLPRHRSIMRMQLRGMTHNEIAQAVGMSTSQVNFIVNSDIYKSELEKLQQKADEAIIGEQINNTKEFERLAGISLEKHEKMLNSNTISDKVKADICWDFLDRQEVSEKKAEDKSGIKNSYVEALTSAYEKRKATRLIAEVENG